MYTRVYMYTRVSTDIRDFTDIRRDIGTDVEQFDPGARFKAT